MKLSVSRGLPSVVLALLLGSCADTAPVAHRSAAQGAWSPPNPAKPTDLPGLHNVVAYAEGVFSGSVPEGDAGFASLAALGIKTVISVDGAKPELAAAKGHGLRYVHLPIGYDGVPEQRSAELALALAALPGPVYVHCHHGKHRSAAALGAACVVAGRLSNDEALARMAVSGTGAEYRGLFASVRAARPKPPSADAVAAARFPEVAKVSGVVEAMTEIDVVFDELKTARAAGFAVPANHPDLVPEREAARLATLLAESGHDDEVKGRPAEYFAQLESSVAASKELAAAFADRALAAAEKEKRFQAVAKSCKSCHAKFRDNK